MPTFTAIGQELSSRLLMVARVLWLATAVLIAQACGAPLSPAAPETEAAEDKDARARKEMVNWQIAMRGVSNPDVLAAMRKVPRHLFIPEAYRWQAYYDGPVPIGFGQTISQPYIVAYMTEALKPKPTDRVLEIGTGCGYQAAVLSRLVKEVYTIEIVAELGKNAESLLKRLGYHNIKVRIADGYRGWPEAAPFDAIIVTAAPDHIPQALVDQLAAGGRLVLPLGSTWQELVRLTKIEGGLKREPLLPVRFVPMTGEAMGH